MKLEDWCFTEGDKDAMRKAAKQSLYVFATVFLGYKDITPFTHKHIIMSLEDTVTRKLICVPRGSLKSSIGCVAYPIWCLLNDPNERILIDSELFTNSTTFLREIRAHLESPAIIEVFGEFKTRTWNESEIIIKQRNKPYKEASISCGGVGTTKVGQHYSKIVADDMNSPSNSNTPEKAQKVIDHYKYNLSILEPEGTYVIIGTRYSENDLIGYILREQLKISGFPETKTYEIKES